MPLCTEWLDCRIDDSAFCDCTHFCHTPARTLQDCSLSTSLRTWTEEADFNSKIPAHTQQGRFLSTALWGPTLTLGFEYSHSLQDCFLPTAQKDQTWPHSGDPRTYPAGLVPLYSPGKPHLPEGTDLNSKTPAHIQRDCPLFTVQKNQTWPECADLKPHHDTLQDFPLSAPWRNQAWPGRSDPNTKTPTHTLQDCPFSTAQRNQA